jgi:DNA-binding transcriptional regulator YdaS (Cro superfamily)
VLHKLVEIGTQNVYCVFMSALDKAIQAAGGLSALAEKIGINPARLGNWRVRGVPIESCALIERVTEGQVTRKELRPDDWQLIWPELLELHHTSRRSTDPEPEAGRAGRTPVARDRMMTAAIDQPAVYERAPKPPDESAK